MKFDSKLIHAGWDSDADSEGSITVPIYKTTAYQFNDTEHAASLFALKEFWKHLLSTGQSNCWCLRSKAYGSRRWRYVCCSIVGNICSYVLSYKYYEPRR